jgi:protein translocase SecG subunit
VDLFLFIALLVTAVGLIASILMQSRGSGLGATFGGGDTASFRTRRGVEQRLYQFTIALAVLFVIVAMLIYISE